MHQSFPVPSEDDRKALHKAWDRTDLTRYCQRWDNAALPPIPQAFLAYDYRACDLGCGFGKYLIAESTRHPQRGYLGIDKGSLRGGNMVKRFEATGNPNLFGLHTNAIPVLATMPDNTLDALTIFYPNPWWPAKHRKKRWSYHPLLPKLATLIKPGGTLVLTSNEAFYLGELVYAVANHPQLTALTVTYAGPIRQTEGRTHFETKFLAEGTWCGEVICTRSVESRPIAI